MAAAFVILAVIGLGNSVSAAAAPPTFWTKCPTGSEAAQCLIPRGIASSPVDGHVFVADQSNSRVNEFDAWGQFVKAWGWGVRDGSTALQTCGPGANPPSASCLTGLKGSGSGQFDAGVEGVATDAAGDVYVVDLNNRRVQKFDPDGNFILMFGGEVNKTTNANLCTAASGDVCGIGIEGAANGFFGLWRVGSYVDVGEDELVYVGDQERVQVFTTGGAFVKSIAIPGETVLSLAVDPSGNLWTSYFNTLTTSKVGLRKLSPAGAELCAAQPTASVKNPRAVAVDAAGNAYVYDQDLSFPVPNHLRIFSSACAEVEEFAGGQFGSSTGIAVGEEPCLSAGTDIYVASSEFSNSFVRAFGPPPDQNTGPGEVCEPPPAPPAIAEQYALQAGTDGATVRASINPLFWKDTSYYVEYGTGKCSEGLCTEKAGFPGIGLTELVTDQDLLTQGVFLAGLAPATTYHFRFVATSSGGGPVYGTGSAPGSGELPEAIPTEGGEGTFTTFPEPGSPLACPGNEAFRTGPSATLPDCRAYEMVSPLDKGDGDIFALSGGTGFNEATDQATPEGEAFTYSTFRPYAGALSASWNSQYIARRQAGVAWESVALNPPRGGPSVYGTVPPATTTPFKAFSEDLCSAWLLQDVDVSLGAGSVPGFANLYRRENCPAGAAGYETLSNAAPIEPPVTVPGKYYLVPQGMSADGAHTAFRASARLTANGSTAFGGIDRPVFEVYLSSPTGPALVSVLPDGTAANTDSSVGISATPGGFGIGRIDSVTNAVSDDASRVYWSTAPGPLQSNLYLRTNPLEPQSAISGGECTEAAKACTVRLSDSDTAKSFFWGASTDGATAIWSEADELREFDAAEGTSTPIAGEAIGVMGMSEDASRVYLASEEVLSPDPNEEGDSAQAGEANLYLYEAGEGGGSFDFIGTLAAGDVATKIGPVAQEPYMRFSRVSPDGLHAAFTSAAALTGFDNTDAESGEPDAEVFRYAAQSGALDCVSCNRTGVRPTGREVENGASIDRWAAAYLPGWPYQLHASRLLSEDGQRLFFESFEALVPTDTNNRQDVYQWEAPGSGSCTTARPTYSPTNGGCVDLLSSGSGGEAEFIDASADGSDVFFTTAASLVSSDPGLIDVYDARVGGGLPQPAAKVSCEGQACQSPPPPPALITPSSSEYRGPGNLAPPKAKPRRCPKGKHKAKAKNGKTRCVKNKKQKKKAKSRKTRKSGRAAR